MSGFERAPHGDQLTDRLEAARVVGALDDELVNAMALLGARDLGQLTREHLARPLWRTPAA